LTRWQTPIIDAARARAGARQRAQDARLASRTFSDENEFMMFGATRPAGL